MTSNVETTNFSAFYDKNSDSLAGNDLEQLAQDTNIVQITRDETSSLESVVLNNGPFQFNSPTYLNDTIKDCLFVNSRQIKNQNFPLNVTSSGYFDIHFDLKSDYFFYPNSLSVMVDAQLYVRGSDGRRRSIQDRDLLVPIDTLQPVKNIRPTFDSKSTLRPGKLLDQKNLGRVLRLLTETTDPEAKKRRENYSRSFFEPEKTQDNRTNKTHSHKWVNAPPSSENGGENTKKVVQMYNLDDNAASRQNTYLSKVIKDTFQFHLDLDHVAPFNTAVVYSRPLESIVLTLEFCKFHEWLRIAVPDGEAPSPVPRPPPDRLQSDLSNLEFDIKMETISYAQFLLHPALLNQYIEHTVSNRFCNIPTQVVEVHNAPTPLTKGNRSWSVLLNNIIVPERIYIFFQSDANKNKVNGNPFYYENLGVSEISLNVLSTSENRYNQRRTSSLGNAETIVRTSEEYQALDLNKKYRANAFAADMILNANFLAAGQSGVNGNSKYTFLANESSIYSGMCVYTLNLGVQLETNRNLKEITRKGNTEITFFFKQRLERDYYCTIFLSYAGEHIVSFCNFSSTQMRLTKKG